MGLENFALSKVITDFFYYIFFPHNQISQIINTFIFFITTCLLVWITAQFYRISSAYIKFIKFKKALTNQKDKHLTHDDIKKLMADQKISLLSKKISAIQRLREDTSGTLDVIDHIDSDLQWSTTGILKYPTGSLIIFGLLGTVWGLQKAIYSLLPTMQEELDLLKLQEVMQGTLSGMQTAFTTTLAGLFCSLIIGFIVSVFLRNYVNKYIANTKQFLIESIIPIYSLLNTDHIETLTSQTKALKESVSDVVKQTDLLFQPIIESANRLKKGMEQIYSAAHTFVTASDSVNNLSKALGGNLQGLQDTLAGVQNSLDSSNSLQAEIEQSIKDLSNLPVYFEELMTRMTDEFKSHQKDIQKNNAEFFGKQSEQLGSSIADLATQAELWRSETSDAGSFLKKASEESVKKLSEDVELLLQKVSDSALTMGEVNTNLIETLENIRNDQNAMSNQSVNTHKEQLNAITKILDSFITDSQKNQNHNNKQMLDAISQWIQYNQLIGNALEKIGDLPERIAVAVSNGNGNGNGSDGTVSKEVH